MRHIHSSSLTKDFTGLSTWRALQSAQWTSKPRQDVDFVCSTFATMARRPIRDVLDVGCGDGALLVPLAARGYVMTGLEIDAAAIARCRGALAAHGASTSFIHADMERLDAVQQYDAVLAIDSVPNYLLDEERMVRLFVCFRQALRPGGVIVLDIWNMLAQWAIIDRPITYEKRHGETVIAFRELHHIDSWQSRMHIDLHATIRGPEGVREVRYEEVLRITTIPEMQQFLHAAGFETVRVFPHHEEDDEPEDNPENLWFVAMSGNEGKTT
jgi:SAM-dependent methyltransferase